MKRTIGIGDPHGCARELGELLGKLRVQDGDHVFVVGDFIDRGPDPCGVLAYRLPGVKGNHEAKLLKWMLRERQRVETGRPNKMAPPKPERLAQWESFSHEDVAYLDAMPFLLEPAPGWLAVHAGFQAIPVAHHTEEVCVRVRYVDKLTGRFKGYERGSLDQPPGTVYWTERWNGPKSVVYGHAVHSLETPRVDVSPSGAECWGIDTGCCFGGRLTALVLETKEIVQVQAHETYCEKPTNGGGSSVEDPYAPRDGEEDPGPF